MTLQEESVVINGRVILDDYLSELHRVNICYMLTHTNGISPNVEEVNNALEYPGMTVTVHVEVTNEEASNMLADMNDCDYLVYIVDGEGR